MARRDIRDPLVQAALSHAAERRRAREARGQARAALEGLGTGSLREISEAAELSREECGRALDSLLIAGEIELLAPGIYGLRRAGTSGEEDVRFGRTVIPF